MYRWGVTGVHPSRDPALYAGFPDHFAGNGEQNLRKRLYFGHFPAAFMPRAWAKPLNFRTGQRETSRHAH
jgi:hypothetical protein